MKICGASSTMLWRPRWDPSTSCLHLGIDVVAGYLHGPHRAHNCTLNCKRSIISFRKQVDVASKLVFSLLSRRCHRIELRAPQHKAPWATWPTCVHRKHAKGNASCAPHARRRERVISFSVHCPRNIHRNKKVPGTLICLHHHSLQKLVKGNPFPMTFVSVRFAFRL